MKEHFLEMHLHVELEGKIFQCQQIYCGSNWLKEISDLPSVQNLLAIMDSYLLVVITLPPVLKACSDATCRLGQATLQWKRRSIVSSQWQITPRREALNEALLRLSEPLKSDF